MGASLVKDDNVVNPRRNNPAETAASRGIGLAERVRAGQSLIEECPCAALQQIRE
jgi:hypothetical protein